MKKSLRVRRSLPAAIVLALIAALLNHYGVDTGALDAAVSNRAGADSPTATAKVGGGDARQSDALLEAAFRDRLSDLQVMGSGSVVHVLPDDNKGSRHQRFLLETNSGLTLLVAHNIDLAPRVPSLQRGDRVAFHGEYEWNEKGGVIHWTHHDPRGSHVGGWLERNGERYE